MALASSSEVEEANQGEKDIPDKSKGRKEKLTHQYSQCGLLSQFLSSKIQNEVNFRNMNSD